MEANSTFKTPIEAARHFGVTRETLMNWEKAGTIQAIRTPQGHRRYDIKSYQERRQAIFVRLKPTEIIDIKITKAELSVISLLVKGISRKEIAKKLSVSISTVSYHVCAVCKRNNIKNEILLSAMVARGSKFVLKHDPVLVETSRCRLQSYLLYAYGGHSTQEIASILNKSREVIRYYLRPFFSKIKKRCTSVTI
jgi:DNA-binding CsgD family transcriptional regulator